MTLKDIFQLFSLNPNDFNKSVRVMIELISLLPILIPLTKIPNSKLSLRLLELSVKHVK